MIRSANRAANRVEAAVIRRWGRSLLSTLYRTPVLVLETTGRRTGALRDTPLAYRLEADGTVTIVGGAAGMARTPDWVANLRTQPRAAVVINRDRRPVVARELEGCERTAAWASLVEVWPRIERYEQRSGRTVPVFVLTLLTGGDSDPVSGTG